MNFGDARLPQRFWWSEGGGRGGARKLAVLMSYFAGKGIDTRGLSVRANNPIRFKFTTPNGGFIADGYEASILPDICAVVIDAMTQGKQCKRDQNRDYMRRRRAA